jgi:hypothetical protein
MLAKVWHSASIESETGLLYFLMCRSITVPQKTDQIDQTLHSRHSLATAMPKGSLGGVWTTANVHHVTGPNCFLSSQASIRTPDPSYRISFRIVLHRPQQLPNDLEHRLELPCDYLCMHLGRSAPERTHARAAGESALVFAPFATSPHHAFGSHRTRIRSLWAWRQWRVANGKPTLPQLRGKSP